MAAEQAAGGALRRRGQLATENLANAIVAHDDLDRLRLFAAQIVGRQAEGAVGARCDGLRLAVEGYDDVLAAHELLVTARAADPQSNGVIRFGCFDRYLRRMGYRDTRRLDPLRVGCPSADREAAGRCRDGQHAQSSTQKLQHLPIIDRESARGFPRPAGSPVARPCSDRRAGFVRAPVPAAPAPGTCGAPFSTGVTPLHADHVHWRCAP